MRGELDREEFEVELESMVTKQKFYSSEEETVNISDELEDERTKKDKDKVLLETWEDNRSSAIFDWEEKSISLASRWQELHS